MKLEDLKKEHEAQQEAEAQSRRSITTLLNNMGQEFGLRPGFFTDLLLVDDDWTAVIKCHALLESVICTLLASHLSKPELEEVLAEEVEMHARIQMLKALNLATDDERRMMRALGTLRNKLVHNAKQTDFTFAEYLKDKGRRDQFVKDYGAWMEDTYDADGNKQSKAESILGSPRVIIWMNVVKIAAQTATAKMQQKIAQQQAEALKGLRRQLLIEKLSEGSGSPPERDGGVKSQG